MDKKLEEYIFRLMARRGKLQNIGGTSYLPAYKSTGRLIQCTPTPGFGYRLLTPSALTSKKGILISKSDNLQIPIGSKIDDNIHEGFSSYQGSAVLWARFNIAYNTDANKHYLWMLDSGTNAKFSVYYDGSDDLFHFEIDVATGTDMNLTASENGASTANFVAGSWLYVVATWNFLADSYQVQVGENGSAIGTKQTNAIAKTAPVIDIGDVIHIGQDSTPANRLNGVIRYRFLNQVLTDAEITSLYGASGIGNVDDWVVTPDTLIMDTFSD